MPLCCRLTGSGHSIRSRDGQCFEGLADMVDGEKIIPFRQDRADLFVVGRATESEDSIHQGKTKLWNAAGCKPAMADMLTVAAKRRSPKVVVWRGDRGLPKSEQGMKVLGVPVGHKEFIKAQLRMKTAEQLRLLERIPAVENVQAGWLLLSFCAATRSNCRTVFELTTKHDRNVWRCLAEILRVRDVEHGAIASSSLPLTLGGCWSRWSEGGVSDCPRNAQPISKTLECSCQHGKHWQEGSEQQQVWKRRGNLLRYVDGRSTHQFQFSPTIENTLCGHSSLQRTEQWSDHVRLHGHSQPPCWIGAPVVLMAPSHTLMRWCTISKLGFSGFARQCHLFLTH